jgi:hypothetical protein
MPYVSGDPIMKKELILYKFFWLWIALLLIPMPVGNSSAFEQIAHIQSNLFSPTIFLSSPPLLLAPRDNALLVNYQPRFRWQNPLLPFRENRCILPHSSGQ